LKPTPRTAAVVLVGIHCFCTAFKAATPTDVNIAILAKLQVGFFRNSSQLMAQ